MPANDRVNVPRLDVSEQSLPCWPGCARVSADVVVRVDLDNDPPLAFSEYAAVFLLAGDAQPCSSPVLTDSAIDRSTHEENRTSMGHIF